MDIHTFDFEVNLDDFVMVYEDRNIDEINFRICKVIDVYKYGYFALDDGRDDVYIDEIRLKFVGKDIIHNLNHKIYKNRN